MVVVEAAQTGEPLVIRVECFADGIPGPEYRMLLTRDNGTTIVITPQSDPRYTRTGGRYGKKRGSCNVKIKMNGQIESVDQKMLLYLKKEYGSVYPLGLLSFSVPTKIIMLVILGR